MAFLDNIFNPSNYSDTISRLLGYPQPQLGASSAGFPDSYGSYGGVNYPIYGGSQDGTTTLSAQAAQPQQPQAAQQQAAQQPQAAQYTPMDALFNFSDYIRQKRGIIPALAGAIAGRPADNPTQATYGALVSAGVPDAVARAASLNPEILKTIAPAYFDTAPKLQETGTNPFTGQKTFGLYKPNMQTLTEAPVIPAGGQMASAQKNIADTAMQNGVTG